VQDINNYRYAIYARKSTEGEERQVRSLGDQVVECNNLAKRLNIQVLEKNIITESESAKEPDIRPKFRKLLEDLKAGRIDGIIAWHPDRLARNMKDAGEIIDLLDKKIIKDLKFVSASFENNAMGKKVANFNFNEPFDRLIKSEEILGCGDGESCGRKPGHQSLNHLM